MYEELIPLIKQCFREVFAEERRQRGVALPPKAYTTTEAARRAQAKYHEKKKRERIKAADARAKAYQPVRRPTGVTSED